MKRKKAGRPPETGKTRAMRVVFRADVDEMAAFERKAKPKSVNMWARDLAREDAGVKPKRRAKR